MLPAKNLNRYTMAASLSVLYYDALLTLAAEIRVYWFRSRMTWPSVVYFINRYASLVSHIAFAVEFYASLEPQVKRGL
ncbi:hypothetical protein QCA50_013727 [Cerrena zonata]|uniref:DUF6533 domain-containing protein n=1 Tax=Cerrena zonata TaxID=2478898 RepID=A0AAW0FP58_9APHY